MRIKRLLALALVFTCAFSTPVYAAETDMVIFESSIDVENTEETNELTDEESKSASDSSSAASDAASEEVSVEGTDEKSEENSEESSKENSSEERSDESTEENSEESVGEISEEELEEFNLEDDLLLLDSLELDEEVDAASLLGESKLAVSNKSEINLKDYAVGDGVTDDTKAIVKALKAANGKKLYVPAGTYCISDLDLSGISVYMYSDENPTFLKIAAKKNPTFTFRNCDSAYITGITFDGNRQYFGDDADTALVYFRGSSNVEITGCNFYNCSREATAFLDNCSDINVHDNYFENTSAVFWLAHGTVQHAKFENNVAYNGRINGVEVALNGSSSESYDLTIRNNEFHDFTNGAIVLLRGISQVVIENNYLDNVKHFVMCSYPREENSADYNVSNLTVNNNHGTAQFFAYAFANSGTAGYTYSNLSFTGNDFTVQDRISIADCDKLTFHNNTFTLAQNAEIRLNSSNRIKLDNEKIYAEDSSKKLILVDDCGELKLNRVKNNSSRTLLRITNESNTRLTLSKVETDFKKLDTNITYPDVMSVVCQDCTNTGNKLKAIYSSDRTLSLPIIGNDFVVNSEGDLAISKIKSIANAGDKITLVNKEGTITFKKDNNITYSLRKTYSKGTKAELEFDGSKWTLVEDLELHVKCSGNCTVAKGGTAVFSVTATGGSGQYKYKWYRSTDNGKTWTRTNAYCGEDPSVISFVAYSKMFSYLFKCEVIDSKTGNSAFSKAMGLN